MGVALAGLVLILYGLGVMSPDVIEYVNRYRLTLYSPGR
jgi:hypothetical protein